MALTPITLYSGVTLASGATNVSPVHATQQNPLAVTTIAGNAIAFNFIIATGSTSCGHDATIVFKYAFSSTSYTAVNAAGTGGSPIILATSSFVLPVPSAVSVTQDITSKYSIPVTGNYFYCWLDLADFYAPLTSGFTASAVPINVSTVVINS